MPLLQASTSYGASDPIGIALQTWQCLTYMHVCIYTYGVATISRLLKIIGLFCKRALQKRPIFCKETYIFKHPTNRSHPIYALTYTFTLVFPQQVSNPSAPHCTQNKNIFLYTYMHTYIYTYPQVYTHKYINTSIPTAV